MGCLTFFGVLLQILFIALKLCNVINWSWHLVLLPIFIYVIMLIIKFIFLLDE